MWVKKVNKKSKVLRTPEFGCLKGIPSINITKGCFHRCVYCYARGFPETPKDHIILYKNTPDLLISELERRRSKGTLPGLVSFSTASDIFQPLSSVQRITYKTLKVLLTTRLKVSILTKGKIDSVCFDLIKEFSDQVQVTIGIISLNQQVQRLFEPYAASYACRLRQIEKLKNVGVKVGVRIDPVIPGVTDDEQNIDSMFKRFKVLGIKEVSMSFLVLRPYVLDQLKEELPDGLLKRILFFYKGQAWTRDISSALTKLVDLGYRKGKYNLFKEIAKLYGIRVRICGCKNPDLPFERCFSYFKGLYRSLETKRVPLLVS